MLCLSSNKDVSHSVQQLFYISNLVLFSCSVVSDSLQPYGLQHARLPSPSPSLGACSNSWLLSWPSNHLVFCCPLLLLPLVFPSIRVFSNESTLHIRWPKYWSFSISPSSEYSGLISFRIDWFDLLAVQGPLKSLLQHHISKASVLHIKRPKQWSCSFSISPSRDYSGLISFRMDWLDLLAVQGTLKSLLQHHSSKASILWCSAFFIVQL